MLCISFVVALLFLPMGEQRQHLGLVVFRFFEPLLPDL